MGTDIHSVFQRMNKKRKGFSKVERRVFNNLSMRKKNNVRFSTVWDTVDSDYEEGRHYTLFGWLADVRNGYGFAGVLQSSGIKPISKPRGFPEDIFAGCKTAPDEIDGKWMGDHSYSWLLGSEIIEAFKNIEGMTRYGVIPYERYLEWDKVTALDSYSGGVLGPKVITLSQKDVDQASLYLDHNLYIQVSWQVTAQTLQEEFGYFVDEIKRLMNLHGEIRMVFGFDS